MKCNTQQINRSTPKSTAASVSLSMEHKLHLMLLFYQYKWLLGSILTFLASGSQGKQAVSGRPCMGGAGGMRHTACGQGSQGFSRPHRYNLQHPQHCACTYRCKSSCVITTCIADEKQILEYQPQNFYSPGLKQNLEFFFLIPQAKLVCSMFEKCVLTNQPQSQVDTRGPKGKAKNHLYLQEII